MNAMKLKGAIAEKGLTQSCLAEKVGIGRSAMSRKMNGEVQFTVGEAAKISEALDLDGESAAIIFLR